jgi:tricorn protease
MSMRCWNVVLSLGLLSLIGPVAGTIQAEEARLLRFPAVHDHRIVFGYAGNLYIVADTGGVARRLTGAEKSYEMFPRFSPDGKWLAFTAQYDGNTEVYVMPSDGGEPRRLTYTATLERDDVSDRMGPNNIVMTWRDNETVVYRSRRTQWNPFKGELTLARLSGGVPEALPLPRGGWCSFSPDGKKLAYNRVFREFRTWKRYRGGQADDIWLYDFDTKQTTRLAEDPAQDIFPMWAGDKIYFVSERGENHQANLWVLDTKTKATRQLTKFTEFAVKFPSLGDKAIVFENGGYIHRLDLATEQAVKVPIEIREDLASGRAARVDVSKNVTTWDIAPDGARAVLGARGDIFTVPAKHGPTRNLTQTPGVHERDAVWSPDGKSIAYISDASGEDEWWMRPQDGSGTPVQLTTGADTYKYAGGWSPDSTRIAWTDKKNRLNVVEVASKKMSVIDTGSWEIHDFAWSPDSKWIAYTRPEERAYARIHIANLETGSKTDVTDGWFEAGAPEFSADGKLLFFVSDRSFTPTYGNLEFEHVYSDLQNIYFVTLTKDAKSPLAPKSDEVKIKEDKETKEKKEPDAKADGDKKDESKAEKKDEGQEAKKDDKKDEKKEKEKKVEVKIDADGLTRRIAVLPLKPGRYGQLSSVGDKLYYMSRGKLFVFEFEKQKETEVGEVSGYVLSANHKKIMVHAGDGYAIADLPSGKGDFSEKLNLADLVVALDRHAEWNQIFHECWRQMRDFLFDPHLHGVDWPAMLKRYEPLVAHAQHRADLTYVIGEMIGELNIGHAYVGGGEYPKPERVPLGLLGARISRHSSGYYRIDEILPGQNWDKKYRSPLTEIGVNAKAGDFIISVDGKPANELPDLYAALVGKADRQVALQLNSEPKPEGAHSETVIPTADEQELYYLKMVLNNIDRVSKATDGKVGYIHIPDMQAAGLNEFAKFYYPQLGREALIVDCRGNGGGNVSPMIIERLRREPAMWTVARNGAVNVNPDAQVLGPKVLLIDHFSASDGDIVGYRFRKHHLGPIIGERSWGGVVGIRGSLPLLDGGFLNRPEFSRFDLEAKEWIMEGVGVEPDITIDNDPAHEAAGVDDQLERAITEIKGLMAKNPVKIPQPPPYPDKSK